MLVLAQPALTLPALTLPAHTLPALTLTLTLPGFSWLPGSLVLASDAEIQVTVQLGAMRKTGTFHKHTVGEESGGPS